MRYLQGAAAEADRLIVAVNDDRSVAGLKGPGGRSCRRPIAPSSSRALRGVDYVVVFGDANVERLLLLLKPDVHCKGTDYTVDSVPERAVVPATAAARRSSATRRTTPRAISSPDAARTTDQRRTR